jgi:Transposase DDE domain
MHRSYSKVNARLVTTTLVTHLVACLQLRDHKRSVPARLLARLLLLAAATGRSLSALAQRCDGAPSDEAVRLALRYQLPATSLVLLDQLLHALYQLVPAPFRAGRPVGAALDLHLRPYYGDRNTPGICGGKREAGTDQFWGYGTLVLLHRGLRLTVGLCPVDRRQSLVAVVRTLLEQAQPRGIRLKWLLLDRGFYDAQVVQYLQQAQVPFVMPLIRRGDAERGTGTQRFFRSPTGWYDYTWTARPRVRDEATGRKRKQAALPVSIRVCVVARPAKKAWVYACWRITWDAVLVQQRYRARFGIETSYRQLGQSLARTTSTDERVRLLLVGLALLVRQYWVWVHYTTLATVAGNGHRRLHPELLQLADVLMWLQLRLATALRYRVEVISPGSPGT